MELDQVKAIITGGASGLGYATAQKFWKMVQVLLFLTKKTASEGIFSELESKFEGRLIFVDVDVTETNSVEKGLKLAIERFEMINVLVNCAGIAIARKTTNKDGAHPLELYKKVIDVNLEAPLYGSPYSDYNGKK